MTVETDFGMYEVNAFQCHYSDNGTLAVQLTTDEDEPFAMLTVNIADSDKYADDEQAFVDVNNCPWAEDFLRENHLAKFTGIYGRSGYCEYPLYRFNLDMLEEM